MDENTKVSERISEDIVQLVCFRLDKEEYAVDIVRVQEVIRIQSITHVPQMPDFVLGVINIRGNIVPLFDLRAAFQLPKKPFDEHTKILVLNVGGQSFSIIVDEILDNVKLESHKIDPAPSIKLKMDRECILGLGEIDNRMIIILDTSVVSNVIAGAINATKEII
ncbi:MAG: chemotaxis protein CheW [Elusimicrobiaceae bacterium]